MPKRDPLAAAFIYGLGVAVSVGWLASVIADIAIGPYATPVSIHGLMGIVLGAVFGEAGLRYARGKMIEKAEEIVAQQAEDEEVALRRK